MTYQNFIINILLLVTLVAVTVTSQFQGRAHADPLQANVTAHQVLAAPSQDELH